MARGLNTMLKVCLENINPLYIPKAQRIAANQAGVWPIIAATGKGKRSGARLVVSMPDNMPAHANGVAERIINGWAAAGLLIWPAMASIENKQ